MQLRDCWVNSFRCIGVAHGLLTRELGDKQCWQTLSENRLNRIHTHWDWIIWRQDSPGKNFLADSTQWRSKQIPATEWILLPLNHRLRFLEQIHTLTPTFKHCSNEWHKKSLGSIWQAFAIPSTNRHLIVRRDSNYHKNYVRRNEINLQILVEWYVIFFPKDCNVFKNRVLVSQSLNMILSMTPITRPWTNYCFAKKYTGGII